MKNTWKYIVGIFGIAGLLYYGSAALEALAAPSLPPQTEQFRQYINRLDAIVDEHWSRDESVPTASDLSAYRDLIDDLSKVDYVPVTQIHDQALKRVDIVQALMLERASALLSTYHMLTPYLGEGVSEVLANIVHFPAFAAADYHYSQVQMVRLVSSKMLRLRPDARYHLAMALILAGENKGAVEQVKLLLKENPDYANSGIPYVIGLRAHADDDQDFLSALKAAGAAPETFRSYFAMFGTVKMLPSYGNERHDQR